MSFTYGMIATDPHEQRDFCIGRLHFACGCLDTHKYNMRNPRFEGWMTGVISLVNMIKNDLATTRERTLVIPILDKALDAMKEFPFQFPNLCRASRALEFAIHVLWDPTVLETPEGQGVLGAVMSLTAPPLMAMDTHVAQLQLACGALVILAHRMWHPLIGEVIEKVTAVRASLIRNNEFSPARVIIEKALHTLRKPFPSPHDFHGASQDLQFAMCVMRDARALETPEGLKLLDMMGLTVPMANFKRSRDNASIGVDITSTLPPGAGAELPHGKKPRYH